MSNIGGYMNKAGKPIARLPTQSIIDEWCSGCGDDNIVIVISDDSYDLSTGNQINLCSKCYHQMQREIKEALNE